MELFLITVFCIWLTIFAQENPDVWNDIAVKDLNHFLNVEDNTGVAKNVILFLGDGMGINTITAARTLKSQLLQKPIDEPETLLEFDKFDNVGLLKTYNIDYYVPDSAGTSTAYLCGVKAKLGTLGLDGRAQRKICSSQIGHEVRSILKWSQDVGKSVGIVTTSRLTHASPAAAYAHSVERNWEGDSEMINETDAEACTDIAKQLVMNNKDIQVLLGGGRRYFLSTNDTDPEETDAAITQKYQRRDVNLIQYWQDDKQSRNLKYKYVWNNEGFRSINPADTDYVLGLFNHGHMDYETDRNNDSVNGEPSLTEMTQKAIEILRKNDNGFFLFIESARIDHAHHDNMAQKALFDTLEMEKAVKMARDMTDKSDTLLMVTADHSHPLNIVGYPTRGHSIFEKVPYYEQSEAYVPNDGVPYTPLLYANGPGHLSPRKNTTDQETNDKEYRTESAVYLSDSTHTGEDVGIFAEGPMAHLFRSVHEQNYVAHVMAYASCVGPYKDKCQRRNSSPSRRNQSNFFALVFCIVVYLVQ